MANPLFDLYGSLEFDISQFNANLKTVRAGVLDLAGTLNQVPDQLKNVQKQLNETAAEMRRTATAMFDMGRAGLFTFAPIVAGSALAVNAFKEFDSALQKSVSIMQNVSAVERDQMGDAARELAKVTTFSAKEAASAFYNLGTSGLAVNESLEALPVVAKFAMAANLDLTTATTLLSQSQAALGLRIRDSPIANMREMIHVADLLVAADQRVAGSAKQFAEALINKSAAALNLLHKSAEEGVAILAALAEKGIVGAKAGDFLYRALRDIQTKAVENADVFKKLGIQVYDVHGKMLPMATILQNMQSHFTGLSDRVARSDLNLLKFTERSASVIQILIDTGKRVQGLTGDFSSVGGTVQKVSDAQLSSFEARLTVLRNRANDLAITFGQPLAESLLTVAAKSDTLFKMIESGTRSFGEMDKSTQQVVASTIGLVGVLGTAASTTLILGSYAVRAAADIQILGGITAATTTIVGGLGLAFGKLAIPAAVLAGAYALYDTYKAIKEERDTVHKTAKQFGPEDFILYEGGKVPETAKTPNNTMTAVASGWLNQFMNQGSVALDIWMNAAENAKKAQSAWDQITETEKEIEKRHKAIEKATEFNRRQEDTAGSNFGLTNLYARYKNLQTSYDLVKASGDFTDAQQLKARRELNEAWEDYVLGVDKGTAAERRAAQAATNNAGIVGNSLRDAEIINDKLFNLTKSPTNLEKAFAGSAEWANKLLVATGLTSAEIQAMWEKDAPVRLAAAFHELGLKAPAELDKFADAAVKDFNLISSSAGVTTRSMQQAWVKTMEALIDSGDKFGTFTLIKLALVEESSRNTSSRVLSIARDINRELGRLADNAARTFVNSIAGIFDNSENRKNADDIKSLMSEMDDKTKTWVDDQAKAAADIQKIQDNLASHTRSQVQQDIKDVKDKLASQRSEYDKFQSDYTSKLSQLQAAHKSTWDKIGDAFKSMLSGFVSELGRFVASVALKTVLSSLAGKIAGALAGNIGGVAGTVGDIAGGAAGQMGTIYESVTGVAGAAGGAASAAGSAGGAAGQAAGSTLSGWIGAISGVATAISSVIGNFQMAGMNKSLDLIEHEVRFSQLHLFYMLNNSNQWWPKLNHLVDIWGELAGVRSELQYGITDRLSEIRDALYTGGAGGGGLTINIVGGNFRSEEAAYANLDSAVRRLKLAKGLRSN